MAERDDNFLDIEIAEASKKIKKFLGNITQPSEDNLKSLDRTFKAHDRFVERFTKWRRTAKPRRQ